MKITKSDIGWSGVLPTVVNALADWNPQPFQKEIEYRDSLARFLREAAQEATVEAEYRHAGTTVDVYVKWPGGFLSSSTELFIEIKRNLRQKTQLDRLVGQIEGLQPSKNKILVILCGDTNPALHDRLCAHYKAFITGDLLVTGRMAVFLKPSAAKATKAGS